MTDTTFRKVTAFVTRGVEPHRQLLTLVHPLGGRQLPAGSVEEGEEPIESAKREVWEETGVSDIEEIALIDVETVHTDGSGYLSTPLGVRSDPDDSAPVSGLLPRGYKVCLRDRRGAWVNISHRIYDFNVTPEVVLHEVSGWVPQTQVAQILERYHYHLVAATDHRQSWTRVADGHLFQVEWVPLKPPPGLVTGQQEWLDIRHARLSM